MSSGQRGQVRCTHSGGGVAATIDGPRKLNACMQAMYRSFREVLDGISADDSVGCLLLTGRRLESREAALSCYATAGFIEGVHALPDKRAPRFSGA